jgi:hypothetical protein
VIRNIFLISLLSWMNISLAAETVSLPLNVKSDKTPQKKSILFGHNLTPTTYTLKKGTMTAGNFMAGGGITDQFMLATSPWLYVSYNMPNIGARYRVPLNNFVRQGVLQAAYFKTSRFYPDQYQMEALSLTGAVDKVLTPFYVITLSYNFMYFYDETLPFSLRQEPHNNEPWQNSVTSLHELSVNDQLGVLFEFGLLGVNFPKPYLHFGASIHYLWSSVLLQGGFSLTSISESGVQLYTQKQRQVIAGNEDIPESELHPEFHAQYFF